MIGDAAAREAVTTAWIAVLGHDPEPDIGPVAAGASSLDIVRLQIDIEERTGVLLDVVDVVETASFEGLVRLVTSSTGDRR